MIQRVLLKLCPPSLRKPAFEVAERTSNICRIMLFGSSIEARCTDNSDIDIAVFGNKDRITLVSRFDNLGKGASGAAVQCMNIMMGIDEGTGL